MLVKLKICLQYDSQHKKLPAHCFLFVRWWSYWYTVAYVMDCYMTPGISVLTQTGLRPCIWQREGDILKSWGRCKSRLSLIHIPCVFLALLILRLVTRFCCDLPVEGLQGQTHITMSSGSLYYCMWEISLPIIRPNRTEKCADKVLRGLLLHALLQILTGTGLCSFLVTLWK